MGKEDRFVRPPLSVTVSCLTATRPSIQSVLVKLGKFSFTFLEGQRTENTGFLILNGACLSDGRSAWLEIGAINVEIM